MFSNVRILSDSFIPVRAVLNVGGGRNRNLPNKYEGWQQVVIDIDPSVEPDIIGDALKLTELPANQYEAVYCSHALEHFYQHDVPTVLAGFLHVLVPDGGVDIAVPDLTGLMRVMRDRDLDINDVWYRASGPVTFHDVLYGWGLALRRGNMHYAHKCGFTELSISAALVTAGFQEVETASDGLNIFARGRK